MRLLLDESVPARLCRAIPRHQVSPCGARRLVRRQERQTPDAGCSLFRRSDHRRQEPALQEKLSGLPIAVIVLDSYSNELHALLPLMPALERTLDPLVPRRCVVVRAEA